MKSLLTTVKFKTVALLIILAAAVSLATSSTLAFFTDSRESTGVFTAGNVYIELTEAAVVADARGNLVEDTTAGRIVGTEISGANPTVHNYGYVFPGQRIHKDPTIKNVGNDTAWVAAKVIIEDGGGDVHKLYGYSNDYDDIDIERLIGGALLDEDVHVGTWNGNDYVCYNDNYAMVQIANRADGKYEFFFFIERPLAKGETVEIFDTFYVDSDFGNTEMQEFRELKVTVQAFGVQQFGFLSCYEAMTTAFSSNFAGCAALPQQ